MSFRLVNPICTLTFALACGSNVVDAGQLPDETGGTGVVAENDAGSGAVPGDGTPDSGSGCAIPDLGRHRLVFDSDAGKLERRIYTMLADGTQLEPLTPPGELAREPALAPDGNQLAYVTPEGIRILSLATGESELRVAGADHPSWSPDGQRLYHRACSGSEPVSCAVVVHVLADGSTEYPSAVGEYPELSADGATLVAGSAATPDAYGIGLHFGAFALGLNEGRFWYPVKLSPVPVRHPTTSPDNVWLGAAIHCPNELWPSLWVSPLQVSTLPCEGRRVTPAGAASVSNPKWGPGNLIAYERATPPRDIAIVDAASGAECVLQGPGDDRHPSWAPLADFAPLR